MLDTNIKEQLRNYLKKLTAPVQIIASVDTSEKSTEMIELLRDINELSDLVSLTENREDTEKKPSFALSRPGEKTAIRFAGIPMGHEFTSLVLALLQIGGYPPKVEPEFIEQVRGLEGSFHFETYISLSCQNCPDVVQALNMMATINSNITHTMIDGATFHEEVTAKNIMAVPTIYLNGKEFGQGRTTAKEILSKIDTKSAQKEAEKIAAKEPFDVLVIGGGAAGASAAIYAARKGIRTGLIAENFGGQVLNTTTIENLIIIKETEGMQLARIFEDNVKNHNIDIMLHQQVVSIIPGALIEVRLANDASVKSKTVILASGARWRELNVTGEKQYIGRGVAFCPHCDGPLYKGKKVAVIGGGNSGVEAAIDLAGIAEHVTLLAQGQKLGADSVLQQKFLSLGNAKLLTQVKTKEITGDDQKVNGLYYVEVASDAQQHLAVDGIFVQIGQQPNTAWLKGVVELNNKNEIVVDNYGRTSVPGIFAAGDATSAPYKQLVIALGDGGKAALSAFDYLMRN